mmetsp:Transcript_33102/g.99747  ORF Transcript_33102/g.99747 Transcript_33102/m.99747 type:complete len:431 (+) Transcript_33102:901-2193(+)
MHDRVAPLQREGPLLRRARRREVQAALELVSRVCEAHDDRGERLRVLVRRVRPALALAVAPYEAGTRRAGAVAGAALGVPLPDVGRQAALEGVLHDRGEALADATALGRHVDGRLLAEDEHFVRRHAVDRVRNLVERERLVFRQSPDRGDLDGRQHAWQHDEARVDGRARAFCWLVGPRHRALGDLCFLPGRDRDRGVRKVVVHSRPRDVRGPQTRRARLRVKANLVAPAGSGVRVGAFEAADRIVPGGRAAARRPRVAAAVHDPRRRRRPGGGGGDGAHDPFNAPLARVRQVATVGRADDDGRHIVSELAPSLGGRAEVRRVARRTRAPSDEARRRVTGHLVPEGRELGTSPGLAPLGLEEQERLVARGRSDRAVKQEEWQHEAYGRRRERSARREDGREDGDERPLAHGRHETRDPRATQTKPTIARP